VHILASGVEEAILNALFAPETSFALAQSILQLSIAVSLSVAFVAGLVSPGLSIDELRIKHMQDSIERDFSESLKNEKTVIDLKQRLRDGHSQLENYRVEVEYTLMEWRQKLLFAAFSAFILLILTLIVEKLPIIAVLSLSVATCLPCIVVFWKVEIGLRDKIIIIRQSINQCSIQYTELAPGRI
jgi:hypothetical protein